MTDYKRFEGCYYWNEGWRQIELLSQLIFIVFFGCCYFPCGISTVILYLLVYFGYLFFNSKLVYSVWNSFSGKRRALIPPSVGYINENLKPIPEEVQFNLPTFVICFALALAFAFCFVSHKLQYEMDSLAFAFSCLSFVKSLYLLHSFFCMLIAANFISKGKRRCCSP